MPKPAEGPWRVSWSREGQSWSILREDGHMIATAFESETNARRMGLSLPLGCTFPALQQMLLAANIPDGARVSYYPLED